MTTDFKSFKIPRDQIEKSSSRSGGAGGQHVNKTNTKIELRFHLMSATWLPNAVRRRMFKACAGRINNDGELSINSSQSRSQHQNEEDCFKKLRELIEDSWLPPKKRIKTRPTRGSKERRLDDKKKNSERKKNRKI